MLVSPLIGCTDRSHKARSLLNVALPESTLMEKSRSLILGALEYVDDEKITKRRHYLIFQANVWGLILMLQLVTFLTGRLPDLKPNAFPKLHPMEFAISTFLFPYILGFLLTHYSRPLLSIWGWKTLNWNSLIPRILATAAIQSFFLVTLTMVVGGLLLHNPELGFKSVLNSLIIWIGNSLLFTGWLGAYFFYHLFGRYNRSENQRLNLVASQKEAELQALKSQVNPHFIFNSLNSLRSLIEENPARARLAVTQFANLIRYSLQNGQLETVSLDEELRVAQDYLALEQVRFQERLQLRFDIEPEALAARVPPMLVQGLVENAIKYGIAQRRRGGEIAIIARYVDDTLCLQVTNPGTTEDSVKIKPASMGLGLNNATHRIRLLFGERATLQLRTDTPGLVIAEVILPLRPISLCLS